MRGGGGFSVPGKSRINPLPANIGVHAGLSTGNTSEGFSNSMVWSADAQVKNIRGIPVSAGASLSTDTETDEWTFSLEGGVGGDVFSSAVQNETTYSLPLLEPVQKAINAVGEALNSRMDDAIKTKYTDEDAP